MKEAVSKKRKVSKKTKKSWRKHIDTKDVDHFLEEKRFEERLGAPFSERSDGELFAVDKSPDNKPSLSSKRLRRLALKAKEPVCFAILKPHTAVPDSIPKRNRVKTPEERKNPITRRIQATKRLNGELKLKEIIAQKNKAFADKKRAEKPKLGEFNEDIWLEDEKTLLNDSQNEWLTADTKRHVLSITSQKKQRIPLSLHKKTSVVPAVENPHPGLSYNPSYNDHQKLLANVAKQEMELIKKDAHLERVTTKMFKKVSAEKRGESWMEEMSEGLPKKSDKPEEKESDIDEGNGDVKSINPPVKNAKKPLVKRRKIKEQRQLALERKQAKVEKKKVADIYKLKRLAEQITSKEQKEDVLRKKRALVKEKDIAVPKTLSKVKFEAPEPDFQLAKELAGSLRNSRPIGNLLRDRFKSLQHRNILAPGTRVMKRNKAKVKKFEKASHKMGWEDTFK